MYAGRHIFSYTCRKQKESVLFPSRVLHPSSLLFSSFRQFTSSRSSLPTAALSTYGLDPKPSEVQRLISTCGDLHTSFGLYNKLLSRQKPTLGVFKSLITTCLDLKQPGRAKDIWKDMDRHSVIPDYWCFTLLLRVCGKIGDSVLAKKLFLKVKNNEFKFGIDIIHCAQMIRAFLAGDQMEDALEVLEWMEKIGINPDTQLYLILLKPCKNIVFGKRIHAHIIKSQTKMDIQLETSVLNMYAKCGSMDDAQSVFNSMQSRDVVSWTAMVAGYAKNGSGKEAIELFQQMQQEGVQPDHLTLTVALSACADLVALSLGQELHAQVDKSGIGWTIGMKTSLLDMYAKCGSMDDARSVFDSMQSRDVVSWTAIISGYAQNGSGKEAIELFKQMQQEGVQPNQVTYTVALLACAELVALSFGREIHSQIDQRGIEWTVKMRNSLLSMYAKCGSMDDACSVFDSMQSKDVASWNTMIAGYGQNGDGRSAIELFKQMEREMFQPDSATFVALLNACSHAGLVDEALHYFKAMKDQHHISAEVTHYNCVVDTLSRAGHLQEAENLIRTMEQPNVVTWKALLGACRWNTDIDRAKCAAENALKLDPQDSSVYVLLANIYSVAGRWDDAAKVRLRMRERAIEKIPGKTWIEINGTVYTFLANDKSHQFSNEIQAEFKLLYTEMKESGYIPNTMFITRGNNEEEKEHLLCSHSEKLAIVFGLINTPPGTPLLIIKNLRVCLDCHNAAKIISKLRARNITVRDSNRFHHFKSGTCSCKDYW